MSAAQYHTSKRQHAADQGIALYFVWEHDWKNNKMLVENAVRNVLQHGDSANILQKLHSPLDRPELFECEDI